MSSDSIHDAVLCAEKRGRPPARSIDAALLVGPYTRNCDYLIINAVTFKALPFSQESLPMLAVDLYPGAKENSDIHVRCRVLVLVDEPMQKTIES